MKTPRELLLARHRAVESKLDLARQRAVAGLSGALQEQNAGRRFVAEWLELFRIPRVAWSGLTAVWLVILGLNLAARETVANAPASPRAEAKRSPETLQALREQKRLFAELIGSLKEMDAEAPRFVPRPRSDRQSELGIA